MTYQNRKNVLFYGISTCALLVAGSASAQTAESSGTPTGAAQAASSGQAEESTGDIVVTGIRRANNAAIEAKRSAVNILDAVGTSDVKALPDTTIVEAIRRIPGLSIIPTTDNEHPQDEAVTPVVRGLGPAYNNVTIDGLQIASPGTPNTILGSLARGARLDILPASMVSQIQVVKSFTADLDPNAVGGAINIVTRSAFEDGGRTFMTMDAALGHNNDVGEPRKQKDPGYRISATASTTFGPDHIFGLTLSGNYQTLSSFTEEHATHDVNYYTFYDNAGAATSIANPLNLGNGRPVPRRDTYWFAQNDRTRWGVVGKFEARPSDAFRAYISGGYFYFKDHYQRNELVIDPLNYNTVQNQTDTSGTYNQANIQIGFIDDNTINKTRMGQVGVDWRPGEKHVLQLRGGLSYATYDEKYPMFKYATIGSRPAPGGGGIADFASTNFPITYDTSKFNQAFRVPETAFYNLTNYAVLYYRPEVSRQSSDRILTLRADYDYNRGPDDRGFNFAAGASYIDDKPVYGIDRNNFVPNTSGPLMTLDTAAGPTVPLGFNSPLNLLTIDPAKALALYNSLPASAWNSTDQTAFNLQDDFSHREHIYGAYALAGYRSDAIVAEAGLHLDDTSQTTQNNIRENGVFRLATTSSSYHKWLPSAIVTWHATPSVDLRGAFSKTLGRPSYDSFAARSSVVFGNPGDIANPNTAVSVTLGNPDLKPRLSTNYDVSLEWSASRKYGVFLSVAGFYKDIADEIFTSSSIGYSYNGINYVNAAVAKPVNASSANIKGVEFGASVNSFGFISPILSGFGATGNVSILKGHLEIPAAGAFTGRSVGYLIGQPSHTINASLFYQKDGLELRAAYNHQGKALRATLDSIYWQDLYWAPRSQLDLSATYTLDNGVAFYAQAANVTHSARTSYTGPQADLLRNTYTVPTTFWVGVRITPKF